MAAPYVDPLVSRLKQTTSTLGRASGILQSAFLGDRALDKKTVAVQLPHRDVPTYVIPNQGVQPWELLPMKAAAMAQYPNFFNHSCMFFGSINRDVVNGLPFCLMRPTRFSLDMAKVARNLGIIDSFELVQRRHRLGADDFVWTSDMPEPEDMHDVALFKHRLLRLHLRTDMFSVRPPSFSSTSSIPPLASAVGLLPLSVRNISRASRPVLLQPRQCEEMRSRLPSGLLLGYHHELGLAVDAQAELYDVPLLVAAHVGLPLSHVAAVRGALRVKAGQEAGVPLRHVTPLKSWNLVELLRSQAAQRHAAAAGGGLAVGAEGAAAGTAIQELQQAAQRSQQQVRRELSAALATAQDLEDGLLAWQLAEAGALQQAAGAAAGGGGQGEQLREGVGEGGEVGNRAQRSRQQQGGKGQTEQRWQGQQRAEARSPPRGGERGRQAGKRRGGSRSE